jgi:microcystin degradation protein MlrC
MRIAAGGVLHETSTYSNVPTTMNEFKEDRGLFYGEEIFEHFRGTNLCVGGFIDGAEKHGFELVPLLWTFAFPSGLIERKTYDRLLAEFLERLQQAEHEGGLVDGVLLDLHGAMVVDGIDDADGHFISQVREYIGPERPILMTPDMHANHTQFRVDQATAIIGYDTYPHIDMNERGREAAGMIVGIINSKIKPTMAFLQIPLFWSTACQVTAHQPMKELMDHIHAIEERPGILSVTISTGFPWSDVPDVGPSVIVVSDNNQLLAETTAQELKDWVWERRQRWYKQPFFVEDAIAQGEKIGKYPIILADHADNTGGGSAGDSTEILQTFIDHNLQDALILYIVDPEVAEIAHKAGVGATIHVNVGGKSVPEQGFPVNMKATVMAISDGAFQYDGPMYAGLTGNMKHSAWIQQRGVNVVVVTAKEQPFGPAFAKTLGIDCTQMRYIALKSAAHFRASFEPFAGSIFNVEAQAVHTHNFAELKHKKRTRPFYPVEISLGE